MPVLPELPDDSWKLDQWRNLAGLRSTGDILAIAEHITGDAQIIETVSRWKPATLQSWFAKHISDRDDAIAMIAVLREAAQRLSLPLFDDGNLRWHADIFLRSQASRPGGFAALTEAELAVIAGKPVPEHDPRYDDADLIRNVFPPPPVRMLGRDLDLWHVLDVMRDSVVTVIVSDPGNGKTALAWHAARQAVMRGLVTATDWCTDKRVMVSAAGEQLSTNVSPLRLETVISSAVQRFGWPELRRAADHQLRPLARARLLAGRYLMVVDNLETVPQAAAAVTELRGLLEPQDDLAPITSRALITSRVEVDVPGVRHVRIGGLALDASAALIRELEAERGIDQPLLTDSQIERLWELTKGNPLCLQIAFTRCAHQNGRVDEVLRDLGGGTGFISVFDALFGPLYAMLEEENAEAAYLLEFGAWMPEITADALRSTWDSEVELGDAEFFAALAALVRYGFVRPLPGVASEYAMHPMIRRYLQSLI